MSNSIEVTTSSCLNRNNELTNVRLLSPNYPHCGRHMELAGGYRNGRFSKKRVSKTRYVLKTSPEEGLGAGLGDLPLRPPPPPVATPPPLTIPSEVDGRCAGEPSVTADKRGTTVPGVDAHLCEVSCRPIPSLSTLRRRSLDVGGGIWLRRVVMVWPMLSPPPPPLPLGKMYPLNPGDFPDVCCWGWRDPYNIC